MHIGGGGGGGGEAIGNLYSGKHIAHQVNLGYLNSKLSVIWALTLLPSKSPLCAAALTI